MTARGDFTNEARTVPFARSDSGAPPRANAVLFLTADWGLVVAPLAIDGTVIAPVAIVTAVTAASNLRGRTASSFEFVERCSATRPCPARCFALGLAAHVTVKRRSQPALKAATTSPQLAA
jgi:hypothetical protein